MLYFDVKKKRADMPELVDIVRLTLHSPAVHVLFEYLLKVHHILCHYTSGEGFLFAHVPQTDWATSVNFPM
jgi:hypothetical protein